MLRDGRCRIECSSVLVIDGNHRKREQHYKKHQLRLRARSHGRGCGSCHKSTHVGLKEYLSTLSVSRPMTAKSLLVIAPDYICGLRLSMDSCVNDGSSTPSGSADTEPEDAEGVRLATEDDRSRRRDRVSFRSFPLPVVI